LFQKKKKKKKNWQQEKASGQPKSFSSSQLPFKYQKSLQLYICTIFLFFYGSGERTSKAFRGIQAFG
jgi:hypothetical protein